MAIISILKSVNDPSLIHFAILSTRMHNVCCCSCIEILTMLLLVDIASSSAMTGRPHELDDFKKAGHFEAKI